MFRNPLIDVIVVLVVVLVIFGPKRLPALGRGLGHGMREFKDGITGKASVAESEEHAALSSGKPSETAAAPEEDSSPEVGSAERRS
jgi:sec-independent protein translocase protein TatA